MLLPVAVLPVIADWPHAACLEPRRGCRTFGAAAEPSCAALLAVAGAVAGAADAAGFAGTANEAVSVAHGHAATGRQTCGEL